MRAFYGSDPLSHPQRLSRLLLNGIQEMYWSESRLSDELSDFSEVASDPALKKVLTNRVNETRGHIRRLNAIFEMTGVRARRRKSRGMASLLRDVALVVETSAEGSPVSDIALVTEMQRIAHFEMACYEGLTAMAALLPDEEIHRQLDLTLQEEQASDAALSELALTVLNPRALSAGED